MIFQDTQTDELFIPAVIDRIRCGPHGKDTTQPCWWVPSLASGYLPAICNARALRAGYQGDINPKSLQRGRRGP